MKTEVYWIAGPWPGRLAIVPRPRGGDWLEDEVRAWRDAGLDVVVSLLTPEESTEFALDQEESWCQVHGIQFHSFPILDRGVPVSQETLADLVSRLEKVLGASKSVAVHCRQSIGRSSLVAATLLVSAGEDPEAAWECISRARGCPVPDTLEQRDWVKAFASVPSDFVRGGTGKVDPNQALLTNRRSPA
jgi:protein-tyrosine phosphatase